MVPARQEGSCLRQGSVTLRNVTSPDARYATGDERREVGAWRRLLKARAARHASVHALFAEFRLFRRGKKQKFQVADGALFFRRFLDAGNQAFHFFKGRYLVTEFKAGFFPIPLPFGQESGFFRFRRFLIAGGVVLKQSRFQGDAFVPELPEIFHIFFSPCREPAARGQRWY